MGIFRDHAAKYFERGLPVMPVWGKRAVSPGWQFAENLHYEDLLEDYPNYNIGLLLGKDSGLVALDWDKPISDYRAFYGILDQIGLTTTGPKKIGRKGVTLFFKWSPELANKKMGGWYDFLVERQQTVLPPSIHPDIGEPYRWDGPSILDFVEQEIEFPQITLKHLAAIDDLIQSTGDYQERKVSATTGARNQESNNSHRNQTLYAMACAAFEKNKSVELVASELLDYDSSNYRTHPEGPWFSDKTEGNGTPTQRAERFAKTTLKGLLRRNKLQGYTGTWEEDQQAVEEAVSNIVCANRVEVVEDECEGGVIENFDPLTDPRILDFDSAELAYRELPMPPGKMYEVIKAIDIANTRSQPNLALGAAVAIGALASSNKICYQNICTNTYVVNVCATGKGKERPQAYAEETINKSGNRPLLGALPNSAGYYIVDLDKRRERLDSIDECKNLLIDAAGGGSRQSPMANIGAKMLVLYNKPKNFFFGEGTKKDGVVGACYSPCINFFGCTTPPDFFKALSGDGGDGFFSRLSVYIGNPRSEQRLDFDAFNYESIRGVIVPMFDRQVQKDPFDEYGYDIKFEEITINRKERESFLIAINKESEETPQHHTLKINLLTRKYQAIIKLCLIWAYYENPKAPIVPVEIMRWAWNVVTMQIETLLYGSMQNESSKENKIYQFICKSGRRGASLKEIYNVYKSTISRRDRNEVLSELLQLGYIINARVQTRGRNASKFFAIKSSRE